MEGQNLKKDSKNRMRIKQLRFVWGMLAIPIASWLVFWLYVNLSSVVQAFQDPYSGAFSWVNFVDFWESLTARDEGLGSLSIAVKNTMYYFLLANFVEFPIQIICSYFLYKKVRGFRIFRIIFYFPVMISAVTMTGVFKEVISPIGPLGSLCNSLGIDFPEAGLLGQQSTATATIMVYKVYTCVGYHMLLVSGAMARIPLEVLESARLDGVGFLREFGQIVIPMIWPTLNTLIILSMTGILSSSGPILLLASDSYALGTTTISYWIFEKVYANNQYMAGQYNLVSATGLCFTVVTVPIILFLRRILENLSVVDY